MKMKKSFAAMLALVTIIMAGCGTPSSTGSSESSSKTEPAKITVNGTEYVASEGGKLEGILTSGTITLAVSPGFAPFEFVDTTKIGAGDEQYVGSDIELARYIAQQLGVELKIETMAFDAVLANIAEGKVDIAISGISPKPERKEKMDFTVSYYDSQADAKHGFLILKAHEDKFQTIEDFNKEGLKIAAQNASIQHSAVQTLLPNAELVTVGEISEAVLEVQTGKVDALAANWENGEGFVNTYSDLAMSPVLLDIPSLGMGIGVPKGNEDLVQVLDAVIEGVKSQGLYKTWLDDAKALQDTLGE